MRPTSQVLLSIHLPTHSSDEEHQTRQRDELLQRLIQQLEQYEIAVTWIVHDPHMLDAQQVNQWANTSHEFSPYLNLELTDTSGRAQRDLLSPHLDHLLDCSRHVGIRVTTLSTNQSIYENNLNLLVRNRISMLNQYGDPDKKHPSLRPSLSNSARFGIWEVPAPQRWPGQFAHPIGQLLFQTALHFKRTWSLRHIQLDIQRMLENHTSPDKTAALLSTLSKMRSRGKIEITPIRAAATRLRQLQLNGQASAPAA